MNATARQWAKVMETHSGYPLHFGPTNVDLIIQDPKRFGFFMARYKFAGKMLTRSHSIVDVGCGDGVGTVSLLTETAAEKILGIDFEARNMDYACGELTDAVRALRPSDAHRLSFQKADFLDFSAERDWNVDGLACLDVIEHIEPAKAPEFVARMARTLCDHGVAVIGTPSLASAEFASVHSRIGHINLYDPDRFRAELEPCFRNVLLFSMNDEMVHTGFSRLAHYLMAVCIK